MNSGEPKCASVTTSSDNRRVLAGIIAGGGGTGRDRTLQAALLYGRDAAAPEQPGPADGVQRGCSGPARLTRTQAAAHAAASARASRRSHCTHSAIYAPGLLTSVPRGAGPCLPQCLGKSIPVRCCAAAAQCACARVWSWRRKHSGGRGCWRTPRFVGSCSTAPRRQAAAREIQGVRDTERRLQRAERIGGAPQTHAMRQASACSMRAGMRRHAP